MFVKLSEESPLKPVLKSIVQFRNQNKIRILKVLKIGNSKNCLCGPRYIWIIFLKGIANFKKVQMCVFTTVFIYNIFKNFQIFFELLQ